MDAGRLTRWLTLGANAGVLIGLLLLIMELDQNRDLMRAQTRHELAMGIVDLLQVPAGDEQLADVLWRAKTGGKLTPTELFQFQLRTNALFRYWEDVHYQYRVGLYDDVEFDRQRSAWGASLAGAPLAQRYWCGVRTYYSPEFMAEMDRFVGPDCDKGGMSADPERLTRFAVDYTAAWNSRDPASVAGFFAVDGTLLVNGAPAAGREAITSVARDFMTAFPDLELTNDRLEIQPDLVTYHWTFSGSNTGPGGTGKAVRFSGFEQWTFDEKGLIARSSGHFDETDYRRQLGQPDESATR